VSCPAECAGNLRGAARPGKRRRRIRLRWINPASRARRPAVLLDRPADMPKPRETRTAQLIAREQRRLRRVFGVALLAASAPAPWLGCDAPSTGSTSGPDAASASGPDGQTAGDVADAATPLDADDADCSSNLGCAPSLYADAAYFDDAMDAEMCPLLLRCGLPQGAIVTGCDVTDVDGAPIGCSVDPQACPGGVWQPEACGRIDLLCRCDLFVGGGRRAHRDRPARRPRARAPLGAYFARMAREEGASIHAFRRLHMELDALAAPEELSRLAAASVGDEARHARVMAGLSTRHGGPPMPPPRVRSLGGPRDLEAMARENAVQGCLRETYGALLAWWQASHAADAEVRRAMGRIAADETRHAALAWAVARWAETRLDDEARWRIARAVRSARRTLLAQLAERPHPALVRAGGLPTPRRARALFSAAFAAPGILAWA
jgi:hypothetical protein